MPEIADVRPPGRDVPEVRELSNAAAGRKIISLLGNINRRKGIFTFLEMASQAWQESRPLFFLAAGDHSHVSSGNDFDRIDEAVQAMPPNFHFVGRRLSDGPEFNAFVAASDVLFCAYWDFPYNSNILTKAAAYKKRVIVTQDSLMARLVASYRLGLGVPQRDARAALTAALRLLGFPGLEPPPQSPLFREYFDANSETKLDQVLANLLDDNGRG